MTTPGTQIVSRAAPPSRGGAAQTGTWHIAALAERGPTTAPRLLYNLTDFDKHFGDRVSYGQRDAVEAHFRNGGVAVNMIRIVGPAATVATLAIPGAAAAASLAADSVGEGASTLKVGVVVNGDGRFVISVYDADDVLLQVSPPLTTQTDAVTWSLDSPYIRIRSTGAVVPVALAATTLAGGDDDRASVTDVHRIAAINRIPKGDGPGQVSIPGATTTDAHEGLAAHAEANNRYAILDATNSDDEAVLVALADADRVAMTDIEESYCFLAEGWHIIPGVTPGTLRVIPPSAVVSALMAAQDVVTSNPNEPAAGINGIARFSLGIDRPNWSDAVRGELNLAGVNVFREVAGGQRLYGYRTLVDPNGSEASWLNAANARLRMAVQAEADELAEPFVFAQITSAKISEYHGVLTGMLLGYYNMGALFGDSPDDAFVVDTGTTVNTPDRIADRRLSAIMGMRMSEFAEVVYMEFVKIPVTEELT